MARDAKYKMVSVFLPIETYRALVAIARDSGGSVELALERIAFHVADDDKKLHDPGPVT